MKTIEKILDIEITTNNERERKLVRIINQKIELCDTWLKENSYGDKTERIIYKNIDEINNVFLALYFMNLTEIPTILSKLYDKFNI